MLFHDIRIQNPRFHIVKIKQNPEKAAAALLLFQLFETDADTRKQDPRRSNSAATGLAVLKLFQLLHLFHLPKQKKQLQTLGPGDNMFSCLSRRNNFKCQCLRKQKKQQRCYYCSCFS